MDLLRFLNEHENWEELLAAPPYYFSIKHEDDYVLIKYNMMFSNFELPICREARGAIFRQGEEDGKWYCVSYGLDKFFNYGESFSDLQAIDWRTCRVMQKVDGTNIRIYMDRGKWHVSTLGCVDAYKAECMNGISFGELVDKACGGIEKLTHHLSPMYCYYFELTGPNRIVINYGDEPVLWYLGRRDKIRLKEDFNKPDFGDVNIKFPAIYDNVQSLTACIEATQKMGADEEGFVVLSVDKNGYGHRIKMKGVEYLRLHKLRCNGPLTIMKVLKMWKEESLDDFLAAFPIYSNFVDEVFDAIVRLAMELDDAYNNFKITDMSRKEIAATAFTYLPPIPDYVFARLDNKVANGHEYINKLPIRQLNTYLSRFVKEEASKVVIEDE